MTKMPVNKISLISTVIIWVMFILSIRYFHLFIVHAIKNEIFLSLENDLFYQ